MIVDRSGENNPDPEIIVTFDDGYTERFFVTGLPDKEYIARAKKLRSDSQSGRTQHCEHCGFDTWHYVDSVVECELCGTET